jgi:uncharacterized protein with PIN domain
MKHAQFRFYAELNDFLPRERRFSDFGHAFDGHPSIKDTIEALGVPHTEVDLILANGESVDFSYQLQDDDRISIYPVFENFDITPIQRLRPRPLRVVRFVLDTHLGRLAAYLRLLGFDTLYRNDADDPELARISRDEQRVLLTRDRGLLKRSIVTHGYYIRETDPQKQVVEVVLHFDLFRVIEPFRRCLRCNGVLEVVSKDVISSQLPPLASQSFDEFRRCQGCGKVFWKGSHYERMAQLIEHVLAQNPADN